MIADIETQMNLQKVADDELDMLTTKVNDCKLDQVKSIPTSGDDNGPRFSPVPKGVIQSLDDICEVDEIQFGDFPPVKLGKFNIAAKQPAATA